MRPSTPPTANARISPRDDDLAAGRVAHRPLVHVIAARTAGGAAAVQVTRLAMQQAQKGISVGVISRPAVVHALGPGCGVLRSASPFRAPLDPLTILRLRRTFDLWAPAAVHAHGVAALVAARLTLVGKTAVPLLFTRRLAFPINPVAARLLRSHAVTMVLASCNAVARVVTSSARVSPARVRVCPDGADVPWLDAAAERARELREALGVACASPLVVHEGVRSWRGGGEVLKAWPAVVRRLPDARLLLAGCSVASDRDEVLDLAAEMGVGGTVVVTEAGLDSPELLAAADLVADASWAGAGVSAAIRDAMALGRPVVAVARDGNLELVQAGLTGLLVPPRDAPTLAAALIRLATDRSLAARLSSAARSFIQRAWSLEGQFAELEALHRELGFLEPLRPTSTPAGK